MLNGTLNWGPSVTSETARATCSLPTEKLKFLVLKLALQLLRLCHLAHGLVEVVLIDSIPVIFDCEQTPIVAVSPGKHFKKKKTRRYLRFRHHVAQISAIQTVTHLDHALKVDLTLQLHRA